MATEIRVPTLGESVVEATVGQWFKEAGDAVATITFNRPDQMNTFSSQMAEELNRGFIELDLDPDIRVILLKGSGRAFCAGYDLKAYAAGCDEYVSKPYSPRKLLTKIRKFLSETPAGEAQ